MVRYKWLVMIVIMKWFVIRDTNQPRQCHLFMRNSQLSLKMVRSPRVPSPGAMQKRLRHRPGARGDSATNLA